MNRDFECLTALPGEEREQSWIQRRLETLDVREATVLAAAAQRVPPEDTVQAINTLQSLDEYKVHFPAGSYEELGRLHLEQDFDVPEEVLPHIDLDKLGRQYEAQHPGLLSETVTWSTRNQPLSRSYRRAVPSHGTMSGALK